MNPLDRAPGTGNPDANVIVFEVLARKLASLLWECRREHHKDVVSIFVIV